MKRRKQTTGTSSPLRKDDRGRFFEAITFNNGITDYFYSDHAHKVVLKCLSHGMDPANYGHFYHAEALLRKEGK